MALLTQNPTQTASWKTLEKHFSEIKSQKMQSLFQADSNRAEKFQIEWKDFFVDFSKNRITEETVNLLLDFAEEMNLRDGIKKYFEGNSINKTENRAVLHTALRAPKDKKVLFEGEDIIPEIHLVKEKIKNFSTEIISGALRGYSDKAFTDIVNIGIGGSDLGPQMAVDALHFYKNHLNTHFISNIDGDHIHELLNRLNPETTLFIVVSKTFSTQETLTNATTAKNWFLKTASEEAVSKHFVAVSTNQEAAIKFGVSQQNIFPMENWVGGRFSLWSAVGLSVAVAVGADYFEEMLQGAYEMDIHFAEAPFDKNIPVILSLLSIWYNNFFNAETEAVIPYSQYLDKFVPFLQQGIMESNGKGIDRNGQKVAYQTGTIIWGGTGSNAQHAFFQLIHQGTKLIPVDFIGFCQSLHGNVEHHDILMANFFAQTEALLNGRSVENQINADKTKFETPYKYFEGNKPTNTILIEKLTPNTLGALIALYEHKIFIQGYLWNIFSFDQWGVELGKELAGNILKEIDLQNFENHDSSTLSLLKKYQSSRLS